MNILFVPFAEISALGGVELLVLRLCKGFTKIGWSCGIAELTSHARAPRVLPANHIPVWSIIAPSEPRLRRPRSWASFVRSTWQFKQVTDTWAPDIVHVHFPAGQCLPVSGAYLLPHRWRLVVTVLGSDIRGTHSAEVRTWQDRLFRRADAVTAVSGSLRDEAIRKFPSLAEKIRVIHSGVDRSWFDVNGKPPEADGRYFLFVGRLHPVKQVDLLLRAWGLIRSRAAGVHLRIVGEGPERENLQLLADQLGLGSSVRFEGFRPDDELPQVYHHAEALILPSRREGLPLALLEAGASGTVLIGTDVPGIADIIEHGETGYLVDRDSPQELASRMLQVLEMPPEQRRTIQTAMRNRVRAHFTESRMISTYESLFCSLVERARGARA